jgi:hypothetical protein
MKPETLIYRLKLKGYTLADVGKTFSPPIDRQLVRYAISVNPLRGKALEIRERIEEILSS